MSSHSLNMHAQPPCGAGDLNFHVPFYVCRNGSGKTEHARLCLLLLAYVISMVNVLKF